MAQQWEMIHFITVPKMTETVILGLALLEKWRPIIWWEGGCRKMKIGRRPLPPPHKQSGGRGEATSEYAGFAQIQAPGSPSFPHVYADLAEMFSKKECGALPPHRLCH